MNINGILADSLANSGLAAVLIGIAAREIVRAALWGINAAFGSIQHQAALNNIPHITPAMLDQFKADLMTEVAKQASGPKVEVTAPTTVVLPVPTPVPAQPPTEKPNIPVYNQD